MNIFLTGASSYVGKYIAKSLISSGHNIISTSRTDPQIKLSNYRWIQHDLSKSPVEGFDEKIDSVIHVAGSAWMNKSTKEYVESNILTTMNLGSFVKKLKPKITFYISSRDIHGEVKGDNINEESPIINPIIYGHTKYIAENILLEQGPTIILRAPSIIGIGTHGWIDSVYKKMKINEEVKFTNSKFNNFIHASEISKIIQKFIEESKFQSSTYVLGCSDVSTSKKVLTQMKNLLNSNSKLTEISTTNSSYTMKVDKLMRIYKTMTVERTIDLYIKETKELNNS